MKNFKEFLKLFLLMFKIGLFTFGGGYAMIAILERELVDKKSWLTHEEFLDIIAISESTPGPIAINSATFIGYKKGGVLGSVFSTLGVVLPSFIIIFLISLFFDEFIKLKYVDYAFRGIKVAVSFIIFSAGIKMLKKADKSVLSILLISITCILMIIFSLFAVSFSSVFFILIGGGIGIFVYLISIIVKNKKENK